MRPRRSKCVMTPQNKAQNMTISYKTKACKWVNVGRTKGRVCGETPNARIQVPSLDSRGQTVSESLKTPPIITLKHLFPSPSSVTAVAGEQSRAQRSPWSTPDPGDRRDHIISAVTQSHCQGVAARERAPHES